MRITTLLASLLALALASGAAAFAEEGENDAKGLDVERSEALIKIHTLTTEGRQLIPATAEALEKAVAEDPGNVDARYRLLGYYQGKMNEKLFEARRKHILWFIENRPEDPVFSTSYVQVDRRFEGETYDRAMTIWNRLVEENPRNGKVVSHAARFTLRNDRDAALHLLSLAERADPTNPEWPRRLAGVYELTAFFSPAPPGGELRKAIFTEWQRTYELTKDENERLRLLPKLASSAYAADEFDAAKGWAEKTLAAVDALRKENLHGEAVHDGNMVLGRLALRAGDVETAKQRMLAAGATVGSPRLNTLGPNLLFAEEMAKQGERDTVVRYLESCRTFWVARRPAIDEWIQMLKEGDTPDFHSNRKL